MMNLFAEFEEKIRAIVAALDLQSEAPLALDRIVVEPPRDPAHGDLATNAALVLAKPARLNPRELAGRIAEALSADEAVDSAEIAGPGFINLRLSRAFWAGHMGVILAAGAEYGRTGMGAGKHINVEYVSANPTGPMHVGHCRGAVVGDALANLLEFVGYDVTREYVINDAGVQIDVLARSVELRYREALGEAIGEIPAGLYPGDYLKPVGEALKEEFGERLKAMDEAERMAILRDRSVAAMMVLIKQDLAALNVHHEVFFSERTLQHRGRSFDTHQARLGFRLRGAGANDADDLVDIRVRQQQTFDRVLASAGPGQQELRPPPNHVQPVTNELFQQSFERQRARLAIDEGQEDQRERLLQW